MTTLGMRIVEALGPIHVIDLPEHGDGRNDFAQQLKRLRMDYDHADVTYFAALQPTERGRFPSIEARGRFLSHLEILHAARGLNAEGIVIFEDDFCFSPDFESRALALFEKLTATKWDIFYGALNLVACGVTSQDDLVWLASRQKAQRSHFIAFQRPAIEALVPYLEEMMRRKRGDPAGGPMGIDDAYSRFRSDHPNMVTVAASPTLGRGRASRSDENNLRWTDRVPVIRELAGALRRPG